LTTGLETALICSGCSDGYRSFHRLCLSRLFYKGLFCVFLKTEWLLRSLFFSGIGTIKKTGGRMSSEMYERMRSNPKFQKLVTVRGRFQWTLSIIVLVLFYGYFMFIAFAPEVLGKKIAEGSMWPIGYTVELFLFVFFWLLTLYYVYRANTEFDDMTQDLIKEAQEMDIL
jgi:uncharacterized membrane protein (DUF485 family)